MHSLNFDATSAEYFARANDEILVVLQTESPDGRGERRADLCLPGVDAIFVGPVDLRANMRSPDGKEATDAGIRGDAPARRRHRQEDRHADRHAHDGTRTPPGRGPSKECNSSPSAANCG